MSASKHDSAPGNGLQAESADRLSRLLAELAAPDSMPGREAWEEPLRPGDRLDRFEVRAELGRGGFGAVYEAWDSELKRAVALKTLRPSRASVGSAASLKEEAEAVAKLNHPGIVTLHDVCVSTRGHYLVMERLEGATLARRLRDGPLPWREALGIASAIAEALAHAHRRGVLHRDLKPANVFLCEGGGVKLLDFGLAHLLGAGPGSGSGGTPAYMAPEQARGDPVDPRADVFALGMVLVEMITGAVPFTAGERGVPGGGLLPDLARAPAGLKKIASRMLARAPAGRPADGAAVAAELAAFERALARRRQRAWLAGAIAASVAAALLALAIRSPRLPPGRLVAAVADLDNRTGDPNLDGFGTLFSAALEQSRRVAVMNRSTLLELLTKGGVRPKVLGETEAVSAARAAAAQLVLVPSIRRASGGFELAVQAVDVLRGRSVFGARETAAAQESLYEATDRLAARVRRALAEDASEAPASPVPVAAFAPANPEALRLYEEAERDMAQAHLRDAKAKWEAALALDPSFPLPRLSILQASLGPFPLHLPLDEKVKREHARALRRDLSRLPAASRPWAETVIVRVEEGYANHTEYLADLDRAIAARPEQPAPYLVALHELLYVRGDAEAARPYLDRALQLAPVGGLSNLTDYLVATERLDEAIALVHRWSQGDEAGGALSLMNLCAVHAVRGEAEEALAAARALNEKHGFVCTGGYLEAEQYDELEAAVRRVPPLPPYMHPENPIIEAAALRGRVHDALQLLRAGPADAPGFAEAEAGWPVRRTSLLLARGDAAGARSAAHEAIRHVGPHPYIAWQLAEAGDVEGAIAISRPAPDRVLAYRIIRALRDWKAGEPDVALAELASIASSSSHFHRGEILAQLDRHREAVDAFRRYVRLSYFDSRLGESFLHRALYQQAASLEALGEREQARRVIGRLLRLWEKADPDLPLLAEAKALERRVRDHP